MNGLLRCRISASTPFPSSSKFLHIKVVQYCTTLNPLPSSPHPSPPQPPISSGSHAQSVLPNGAKPLLQNGLAKQNQNQNQNGHKAEFVDYKNMTVEELLNLIKQRKQDKQPQDILNFVYLLSAYRKDKNTQGVIDAIVMMRELGIEPTEHVYNLLVSYFTLIKDPKTVKELYMKMRAKNYSFTATTFSNPVHAFLVADDLPHYYQDGIDVFHQAINKGIKLSEGTYFLILAKSIEMNDDATCQLSLSELAKQGLQPPDSKDIFNMYLSSMTNKRDHEGILRKYGEMRSLGLYPSNHLFSSVLRAASARNDPVYIRSVFSDMSAAGARNLVTCIQYVRALAPLGDFAGCFEEITRMRMDGLKPHAGLYNPLLEALETFEDRGGMARALSEMAVDGVSLNTHTQAIVERVMGGKKLEEIREKGVRPTIHTYNMQLTKLVREDDQEGIERTLEDMQREGIAFNLGTYNILVPYAVRKENYEKVRQLHAKLQDAGVRPDMALYHALTQGYVRMNDGTACAQLVDAMLHDNVHLPVSQFQALIAIIAENYDLPRCHEMLARMRNLSQTPLDVPTYALVIELMLSKGDMIGCNGILSEMQSKGIKPSHDIYNSLISFAAQRGDKNGVRVLMDEMATHGLKVDLSTYTKLFEGLALSGDAEECNTWVDIMRKNSFSPTRAIYHSIVQAKAMREDAEGCSRIVREMGVRGMKPEPQAYALTLSLLVKKGDQYNSRALYDDMRRREVQIDRNIYNLIALVSNTTDGMRMLNEMRECGVTPDVDTYRALLGNMGLRGDVDGCRWALAEMDRDGVMPDLVTYYSLVANLGKHADTKLLCSKFLEAIPTQVPFSHNANFFNAPPLVMNPPPPIQHVNIPNPPPPSFPLPITPNQFNPATNIPATKNARNSRTNKNNINSPTSTSTSPSPTSPASDVSSPSPTTDNSAQKSNNKVNNATKRNKFRQRKNGEHNIAQTTTPTQIINDLPSSPSSSPSPSPSPATITPPTESNSA